MIQSHASLKSLKRIAREGDEGGDDDGDKPTPSDGPHRKSRDEGVDFRGERRGNTTHRSATDPEARLSRKGNIVGAFLSHTMHALTENRNGLVLAVDVAEANGRAEREGALRMVRSVHTTRVAMGVGAHVHGDTVAVIRRVSAGARSSKNSSVGRRPSLHCEDQSMSDDGRWRFKQ